MKKTNIAIICIIILSFILSIYSYQTIPGKKVASHWNVKGEVDGYMLKFWGLFLMPIISLALYLLLLLIPKIDPLKKNIEKFRKYYDYFILMLMILLLYIFILTILANLGYRFNMNNTLIPAIGFLLFYIGIIMKKMKRNWFIGIRTPWTLSSDKVWKKTHILGGRLFIISGVIMLIGIFFQKYLFWFILIPILIAAISPIIYSYIIYRRIKG